MRVVWAQRQLYNQFPPFFCCPLTLGTLRTSGLSIPWCCLPTSFSASLVFFPFHCALQDSFERKTCPYYFCLCIFTMIRSSCGFMACWILAWTSWSLYEITVSCSSISFPWLVFYCVVLLWGPQREAGDVWCLPPVWNLRAVIWFHFAISSLVLLPSPVTLSVLSFSACWPFLLNFFQKILKYFSLRDRLFCMAPV